MRPRRPLYFRALWCSVALVAACRSIIGLDEYTVDPNPSGSAGTDAGNPLGSLDSGDGDSSGGADAASASGNVDAGNTGGAASIAGAGAGGVPGGAGGMGGMNTGGMPSAGTGGGAGANDCGAPPNPGACIQAQCDGMCQDGSCVHPCISTEMCGGSFMMNNVVACGPPTIDFPCVLLCNAGGACPAAVEVSCPGTAPCTVDCTGPGACTNDTKITCRDGPCQVFCGASGCDASTEVTCGQGPCIVTCEPGASVTQIPGQSCDAQTFGCD